MPDTGLAGMRVHAPERIEDYDDEEIYDIQQRLASWFITQEGVDAGTRKKRKRLGRETIDNIQPVFQMLGLGCLTDKSGTYDLIESGEFVPLCKAEEAAQHPE